MVRMKTDEELIAEATRRADAAYEVAVARAKARGDAEFAAVVGMCEDKHYCNLTIAQAGKLARQIDALRSSEGWTVSDVMLYEYPYYQVDAVNELIDYATFTFRTVDHWRDVRKAIKRTIKSRS